MNISFISVSLFFLRSDDTIISNACVVFQPNVPALTISQPDKSIEVLKSRAKEIGVSAYIM